MLGLVKHFFFHSRRVFRRCQNFGLSPRDLASGDGFSSPCSRLEAAAKRSKASREVFERSALRDFFQAVATGRRSASANAPGARIASRGHAPARCSPATGEACTQETSASAGRRRRRTSTPKEALLRRSERRDARGHRGAVPGGDTSTTVVKEHNLEISRRTRRCPRAPTPRASRAT